MLNSPYKIYQQSSVQTASGSQLVIMLYEGAIRFTKSGIEGIQSKKYELANTNFKKAQAVINELIASLDHNYSISNDLVRIYEYVLHLLIESNVKKDERPAIEAVGHLTEILASWKQAAKEMSGQMAKEAGTV